MGILDTLMGNAREIDKETVSRELGVFMVQGEEIALAYKLVRDMIVLTNRRILTLDKQGLTGKKTMVSSIPYSKIVRFARESAGMFDHDAELYLWVGSNPAPLTFTFTNNVDINKLFRTLSYYVQ